MLFGALVIIALLFWVLDKIFVFFLARSYVDRGSPLFLT